VKFATFGAGGIAVASAFVVTAFAEEKKVDYRAVREDIKKLLDKEDWDDGSVGPVFVRLAWHASGTYDHKSKSGGSAGATMRFAPESTDGANAGLEKARAFLEPVKAKHPNISYSDLWVLAGNVAIEEMGGPQLRFTPGRVDHIDDKRVPKNGLLPDAAQGAQHIRDVFYRMGFNDQEIVALVGAHCLGRCHSDRSGFVGPWTRAPTTFSNLFFKELLENKWEVKQWSGPKQYSDPSGELMMLPADLALRDDPAFRKYVELYAKDEAAFFKDFASAWAKLTENGFVMSPSASEAGGKSSSRPLLLIGLVTFVSRWL